MDVQEYSVKIYPLFADAEKIHNYLDDINFSDVTKIILNENSFQVAFNDYNRAVELKNFIDGQIIAANVVHAEDPVMLPNEGEKTQTTPQRFTSPPQTEREYREKEYPRKPYPQPDYPRREAYPPRRDGPPAVAPHDYRDRDRDIGPQRRYTRTLEVRGYPQPFTKRDIWDSFKSFGYLKQIEIKENTVLLQYDTKEDALNAVKQAGNPDFGLANVTIEMIPDKPLNIPRFLVPLVVKDDPRGLLAPPSYFQSRDQRH